MKESNNTLNVEPISESDILNEYFLLKPDKKNEMFRDKSMGYFIPVVLISIEKRRILTPLASENYRY
jgi:hypothetical protein